MVVRGLESFHFLMNSEEHQVVAIQNLQKFRRVVAHQELCKTQFTGIAIWIAW